MFTLFGRYHRHRDYENAINTLSEEIATLKTSFATFRAKYAVTKREVGKKSQLDAEIAALEAQLGGKTVAILDDQGKLMSMEGESDGS